MPRSKLYHIFDCADTIGFHVKIKKGNKIDEYSSYRKYHINPYSKITILLLND